MMIGRPYDWLMFSADGGVSYSQWCDHTVGETAILLHPPLCI